MSRASLAVVALACALVATGCGGSGNADNGATGSGATGGLTSAASPPAATQPQTDAPSYHHRRRHRHGRHAYGSQSGAGSDTGGAGVGTAATGGVSASGAGAVAAGAAAGGVAGAAGGRTHDASAGAYPCDDAGFVALQQQYANGAAQGDREVDVCGTVTRVLPSRVTRSGPHGYYLLQVSSGDTIEIVSDLAEMNAPAWPWVKVGDYSYVQGRYYYDSPSSQGIDWTHHGTSRSWPSAGYVVIAGTQYR